jgi:hypothetical protein
MAPNRGVFFRNMNNTCSLEKTLVTQKSAKKEVKKSFEAIKK